MPIEHEHYSNYVGRRYGRLVIMDYLKVRREHGNKSVMMYYCICDCGRECFLLPYNVIDGHTKSCGCWQRERYRAFSSPTPDLTGQRFGLLTVLRYDTDQRKWLCRCDCGNEIYLARHRLINKSKLTSTRSCGCLRHASVTNSSFLTARDLRYKEHLAISDALIGKRFGFLTITERVGDPVHPYQAKYKCTCVCGNTIIAKGSSICSGMITSCGICDKK